MSSADVKPPNRAELSLTAQKVLTHKRFKIWSKQDVLLNLLLLTFPPPETQTCRNVFSHQLAPSFAKLQIDANEVTE